MADDVLELSRKAAKIILAMPESTRFRVISHYDADGITAAGIICTALNREGYDFHVSLMRNPLLIITRLTNRKLVMIFSK